MITDRTNIEMRIKLILSVCALLSISVAFAQPKMEFVDAKHNFGEINEEKGNALHQFEFKNAGNTPLKIETVKAACGCTTPGWTRQEIMPNETGFIKVEYNPAGRPGPFHKTVTVMTNEFPNTHIIHISGEVIPKPKTPEEDFPYAIGQLRARSKFMNVGGISTKEPVVKGFSIYNNGTDTLTYTEEFESPKYISIDFEPKKLLPEQKGQVILTFDAKAKNDLGYGSDNIVFYTNEGDSVERKEFYVMSTISEYFPPMSESEMANAPRLAFGNASYDFGDINSGNVVTTEFLVRNTGKSDLNIRKIKTNCGCTESTSDLNVLKAGEQTNLVVSFNPAGRNGRQKKTVTVFSNDPLQPSQQIEINAYIKD